MRILIVISMVYSKWLYQYIHFVIRHVSIIYKARARHIVARLSSQSARLSVNQGAGIPEMAKVITVFGATGAQGGPIARALLTTEGFKVRAVTRNPDSEKAKALKEAGAEVVKADMSDVSSVDAALQGAYGAFVNTNYWELLQKLSSSEAAYAAEIQQGKALVDAAFRAGVKHYVYSSLDSVLDKMGKTCEHLDAKAEVEKHLVTSGVPYSVVRYPFYFENFVDMMLPQKHEDGTFSLTLPMDGPMYAIGVAKWWTDSRCNFQQAR